MILKVEHLEMVRAIHQEGTLTGAARRLFISQPALSRRLKKLERRIGAELFHRHQRGMTLTREGHRVLDSASRVLSELERVEHDVKHLSQGRAGTVRIATEGYMCYHWLPWVARQFGRRYPEVELLLVPEVTRDPYTALDQGAVDVAIVHSAPPSEMDVRLVEIFEDEMVAVLAESHRLAQRDYLRAEDFREETLICHSAAPDRGVLESQSILPGGVPSQRTVEMMVTPAVLEMANAGYGIAILPRWILGSDRLAKGTVVRPLTEKGLWRSWSVAIPAARSEQPMLLALIKVLQGSRLDHAEASIRRAKTGSRGSCRRERRGSGETPVRREMG